VALPRKTILDAIYATVAGITTANGYTYSVRTIQIGQDIIPQRWLTTDYPLVVIDPLRDESVEETFGGGTANKLFRKWPIHITGVIQPTGDVREEGEKFLSDLVKALVVLKFVSSINTRPVIDELLGPDNFERSENKIAVVGVNLGIYYHFTPGGL
jgi:hypothetical protein